MGVWLRGSLRQLAEVAGESRCREGETLLGGPDYHEEEAEILAMGFWAEHFARVLCSLPAQPPALAEDAPTRGDLTRFRVKWFGGAPNSRYVLARRQD